MSSRASWGPWKAWIFLAAGVVVVVVVVGEERGIMMEHWEVNEEHLGQRSSCPEVRLGWDELQKIRARIGPRESCARLQLSFESLLIFLPFPWPREEEKEKQKECLIYFNYSSHLNENWNAWDWRQVFIYIYGTLKCLHTWESGQTNFNNRLKRRERELIMMMMDLLFTCMKGNPTVITHNMMVVCWKWLDPLLSLLFVVPGSRNGLINKMSPGKYNGHFQKIVTIAMNLQRTLVFKYKRSLGCY